MDPQVNEAKRAGWRPHSKYNACVKIRILGSGTSHGVPMIGCDCAVCLSSNPKNHRNRSSALISTEGGYQILIDTPPELRLMATTHRLKRIDAVLFTHSHADHLFGLDDLRAFNYLQHAPIPLYAQGDVLQDIRTSFPYCFKETQKGGGKPQLTLNEIEPLVPINLFDLPVLPLRVMHGSLPILGYRLGSKCAYLTDVSEIVVDTQPYVQDVDLLFLDAVRYRPHNTHFHLDKALDVISRLRPQRCVLIHLSHDYDHEKVNAELPDGVELAYDGMELSVEQ
jgi:phosphoribosyl 1,2-cyclic phosphate phosphodiesterase